MGSKGRGRGDEVDLKLGLGRRGRMGGSQGRVRGGVGLVLRAQEVGPGDEGKNAGRADGRQPGAAVCP